MTRVTHLAAPDGRRATLIAGITGLASDADLVRAELGQGAPAKILLGIPYEDLDSIRATSGKEHESEFEAGSLDEVYLERLKRFGAVQSPPPDLYVAYRFGQERSLDVDAIDLGDEAYTDTYTKNVGFLEVMRSSRQQRKMPTLEFAPTSADSFIREWDETLNRTKGLRRVQEAREEAMASAIEKAAAPGRVLALVPLARASGIIARLHRAGWSPA